MTGLPKKCLVDTNVPKTANLALDPARIPQELTGCVLACVEAIYSGPRNPDNSLSYALSKNEK
jgi:hypothetical protein